MKYFMFWLALLLGFSVAVKSSYDVPQPATRDNPAPRVAPTPPPLDLDPPVQDLRGDSETWFPGAPAAPGSLMGI